MTTCAQTEDPYPPDQDVGTCDNCGTDEGRLYVLKRYIRNGGSRALEVKVMCMRCRDTTGVLYSSIVPYTGQSLI